MEKMQKQSIMIILSSVEQQLAALRTSLMLGSNQETATMHKPIPGKPSDLWTTDQEDAKIAEALAADNEQDQLLQEIFEKAQNGEQRK